MVNYYEDELKKLGGFENILKNMAKEIQERILYDKYAPSHHIKSIAQYEKLSRLSDQKLLETARKEYEGSKQYYRQKIGEEHEKINLLEDALEKVTFALKETKNPSVKESLEYIRGYYKNTLNGHKNSTYNAEKLLEKMSDSELLAKKKEDIGWSIKYHKEEFEKEQADIKKCEDIIREYMRLYVILSERTERQVKK